VTNPKFWWVTRPTRDPNDFDLAITAFKDVAEGKNWRGDRELHRKFERALAQVKTFNVSRDGSGGRTWAALLRSYGFWYNETQVTLTPAAITILENRNAERYKQIVHQILNFQLPSAYSEHKKLEPGFKIFPFRFILKLLLDIRIKYLEENEIALFVLAVKKEEEFEKVVANILKYRTKKIADKKELKDRTDLISSHMKKYRPKGRTDTPSELKYYLRYLKDIANTFLNNIRYIHEIKYSDSKIWLDEADLKKISEILKEYDATHPFSSLYNVSDIAFECHYGVRYDRHKASQKSTRPKTRGDKNFNRVKIGLSRLRKTRLMITNMKQVVEKVSEETSLPHSIVGRIISEYEQDLGLYEFDKVDRNFIDNYLECGKSGRDDQEFEELTREIFRIFGYPTNKEFVLKPDGRGKYEIDGLIRNQPAQKSGILECKSGSIYTFPNSDCAKMKADYIPKFDKFPLDQTAYSLEFFVYVVGNTFSGYGNFKSIITGSGLSGSVILAKDLLKLLDKFYSKNISKKQIWDLLKLNKQITALDF